MSETKKSNAKKKTAAAVAVILLLSIAFGSTYAWKDYKQHKTNEFANSEPKYEAVLAEDFQEKENWRVSDGKIKKTISVTNTGIAENGFEAVYVRIQLKEYMEIVPLEWKETADRYMVDTDGKYIVFKTEAQARASYPDAPFDELKGGAYKILTDAVSGVTGWFIPTKEYDENGQYGKYVVTKYELGGDLIKVTGDDIDRADEDAQKSKKHDVAANGVTPDKNGECDYRKYIWEGTQLEGDGLFTNTAGNPTMEYIKWILGENVITLSEWMDRYNGAPVAMWIIDDTEDNDNPWIYWGQRLSPGEQTADFLSAVELIKQPAGNFYYAIHTEMQAVSLDELADGNDNYLLDWNQNIVDGYLRAVLDLIVKDSSGEIIEDGTTVRIQSPDEETEIQYFAEVKGKKLKLGTAAWSIQKQFGRGAEIDPETGVITVPADYIGRITVRVTSDDDPSVFSEFILVFFAEDGSNDTGGSFGLTGEQGENNSIDLQWDEDELPKNKNGYEYKIYQSTDGGETWEPRSPNYERPIKVLNVYPNVGDMLKTWMETNGAGMGLISVDKVNFTNFNKDANSYLKNAQGEYKYDVIVIGTWDSNNWMDLSASATAAIAKFLDMGRGVLFGHDTLIGWKNFTYLNTLNRYVNIKYGAANHCGSSKIKATNDGFLLKYPWTINMNSILTVPYTHTSGQFAYGTVWMQFTQIGTGLPAGYLVPKAEEKTQDGKGTNNWYLTTWNNAAMIQTGSSNSATTTDEQRVIANTIMYLAQVTTGTTAADHSAIDRAAPNTPAAAYTDENTISIMATDNGTMYQYYIEATDKDDPSKVYESNRIEVVNSGLKGFYVSEDTNESGVPNTAASTFIPAADNEIVTYGVQNNNRFVHIIAVDKAGNLSAVKTVGSYSPPEVTGFTVSVTGGAAHIAESESFTMNLLQDENNRTVTLNGFVEGTNLTDFPNGLTAWTKSGSQSAWGAANGNSTAFNITIPANAVGTITVTGKPKDAAAPTITVTINVTFEGSGTSEDPWLIKTPVDLEQLAAVVNNNTTLFSNSGKYYKQANNISLSDYSSGAGWTPIGNYSSTNIQFRGNYDGDGKNITGLFINRPTTSCVGLFGFMATGSVVKGVTLQNANVTGGLSTGGIAGNSNGTVTNCSVSGGKVSGPNTNIGGLVGCNRAAVTKCFSTCSVSGTGTGDLYNFGGVVGYNVGSSASVINCYSTGNVSSLAYNTGGVVGANSANEGSGPTVENCYATGNVSGNQGSGGIVGVNDAGCTTRYCAAFNLKVTGNSNIGRVIGYNFSGGTIAGLRAYSGMTGATWGTKSTNAKDGSDVTSATAKTVTFWQATMEWSGSVWTFEEGKLPILKNVGGTQTGNAPF